jgi:hypothetical protein
MKILIRTAKTALLLPLAPTSMDLIYSSTRDKPCRETFLSSKQNANIVYIENKKIPTLSISACRRFD